MRYIVLKEKHIQRRGKERDNVLNKWSSSAYSYWVGNPTPDISPSPHNTQHNLTLRNPFNY